MNLRIFIYFSLATLFWGLNFHFGKLALKVISPNSISFYRFLFSSIGLGIILLIYEKIPWGFIFLHFKYFLILSTVGIFMYNNLFYIAMQYTTAVNASLIVAFNPIITTVIMFIVFHKEITKFQVIGMIISLLGVFTIISKWDYEIISQLKFALGDLLMLLVTSTFVFYNIFVKRWFPNTSALLISTMITILSMPLFSIVFYWDSASLAICDMNSYQLGLLLAIALGGSVFGSILWNQALKSVSPELGAVFVNFIPLFAILTAPLFGEYPTLVQLLGGILIILGVLIVNFGKSWYQKLDIFKSKKFGINKFK
jgi:drug/metabolite transporter (DMT)-like permease